MLKRQIMLIVVSFFLGGCAWTTMTAIRDPSAPLNAYRKILVIAPFSDLESRTQAENAFIGQLTTMGVQGIPSLSVILPTRNYSDEELVKIIRENSDAVLFVKLTDAYTKQTYVPKSSTTEGTGTLSGNIIKYSEKTQYSGGYYISKPRVRFKLTFLDVSTGKVVWVATSLTRGNAFARFDTLMNSLAQTAIQKIKEDNMLQLILSPPNQVQEPATSEKK